MLLVKWEEERKKKESKKAAKGQEKKLESAAQKNGKKFGLGKLVPKKAKTIFGNIINFFITCNNISIPIFYFSSDRIQNFDIYKLHLRKQPLTHNSKYQQSHSQA